jgi:prevent-host-death family protein
MKRQDEMKTIGAFEAKTHFARLLERVAAGESITITQHGRAVARLVPVEPAIDRQVIGETIARLKAFSRRHSLDGLDWESLRDEGRC